MPEPTVPFGLIMVFVAMVATLMVLPEIHKIQFRRAFGRSPEFMTLDEMNQRMTELDQRYEAAYRELHFRSNWRSAQGINSLSSRVNRYKKELDAAHKIAGQYCLVSSYPRLLAPA